MLAFFYTSFDLFMFSKKEQPELSVILYQLLNDIYIQVSQQPIVNKYGSILVPIYQFVYHGIFGSHI